MYNFTIYFVQYIYFFEDHPPLASMFKKTWKRLQLSISDTQFSTEQLKRPFVCYLLVSDHVAKKFPIEMK